jgi:hypothetical protein
MTAITNVTVLTTTTNILTSAASRLLSGPLYVKNTSAEVVTLVVAGSDAISLDPGEPQHVLPGQLVTGTSLSGTAVVQVYSGIVPTDESASKSGGSVVQSGSASVGDGRSKWSVGQNDFTAVYASSNTLTLGTFPTAMGTPVDADFCAVIVTDENSLQRVYVPTQNAMSLSGQVLTVDGAAFVTGGSADLYYDVIVWGPPREHDASINGQQTRELSPLWARQLATTPADVTDVTDGTVYYPSTAGIDVDGYHYHVWQIALDCDAGTVTVTIEASAQDDGTAGGSAGWEDVTQSLFGVASLIASAGPATAMWVASAPAPFKRLRQKVVYNTTANTGDNTTYFRASY